MLRLQCDLPISITEYMPYLDIAKDIENNIANRLLLCEVCIKDFYRYYIIVVQRGN